MLNLPGRWQQVLFDKGWIAMKNISRILVAFLSVTILISVFTLRARTAPQPEYERLRADAEKLYAEGSYSQAHELYQKADRQKLPTAEVRWVDFRLADTLWRAQVATQTNDDTKYQQARAQLESLIAAIKENEERDLVWAEAQQSLGDSWWSQRNAHNPGQAWPHYQAALDWWAGQRDTAQARQRYIAIVRTMAKPAGADPYYYYGYYGGYLSRETLSNYLKIAESENDKAHAHYLMAMTLRYQGGDVEDQQRIPEEFEAALKAGKTIDWYDDALFHYAQSMESTGRITVKDDGSWHSQQDYVKALELYRRIISEFSKGETRYYDQAQGSIQNITRPSVSVSVQHVFLPDSEIQFHLNWRNVKRVDLALYKIDLTTDVRFSSRNDGTGNWLQRINLAGREKIKTWSRDTADKGDYQPGNEMVRLDVKIPVGAYVLEATAGSQAARELILVTDATLVMKTAGNQVLAYFCHVVDGSPVAGARVRLWVRDETSETKWVEQAKETNADGIAVFEITNGKNYNQIFLSASLNNRQAFSHGYNYGNRSEREQWRIYASTDRPAYRPQETAQWKFTARKYLEGNYSTPAGQVIHYEITSPRGEKVKEGDATLNAFGSAWGQVEVTDKMPLGQYTVTFHHKNSDGSPPHIGNAALFRIEEYKLPEFKVSVRTPEENGKQKAFRLGEKVEVQVQADYYFGGAVANANVELIVSQNPFYHWWRQPRDYPWLYQDEQYSRWYGRGNGQVIKRETIKTDAMGKAVFSFETLRNQEQDFEYHIEARATDASRREITANGNVRVTRQRYYVYPQAQHNLYRPQDTVTTDIRTLDANQQPMQVEGTVKVTRDYWSEIWLDPSGKEITGEQLRRLIEQRKIATSTTGWRIKFRGYQHEEILTRTVKTDAEGKAELSFTPAREGWYRIAWSSTDKTNGRNVGVIQGEIAVWVTTNATTELGYRHGGLEIITDKDTFRAGQKAPVMLHTPVSDRYVLFSLEGDNLYSYQLVHLTGTVKLLEIPVEAKHEPNIFLNAVMVSDRQIFSDQKQIVVPPEEHYLKVEVKADQPEYQARESGTLTVTARDHLGKPVAAEIALSLVDESVFYIQQDYAADPRQFFYGTKRDQHVQTTSTMQQKNYARLVEVADKQLMDDRQAELMKKNGSRDEGKYERLDSVSRLAKLPVPLPAAAQTSAVRANSEIETRIVIAGEQSARDLPINGRQFNEMVHLAPGVAGGMGNSGIAEPAREPAVVVRNDFRSTVFWQPDVTTNKDGTAAVKIKYPDSLTTWKATARAVTASNQFGIATASTRTRQPLIVRLQAPRFFVVGDMATVSAVINNNTEAAMTAMPAINAEGVIVTGLMIDGKPVKGEQSTIEIPANAEKRVDWLVSVQQSGAAKIKVTARNEKYADAMERSFVVHEHGIEKFLAKSGKMRGNEVALKLDIPKERKTETTTLNVQVAPSLAVTMLDALPYLASYPYGCVEQTMSRFLPATITAKTLRDLGISPEDAMSRIFGGIERRTEGKTHPEPARDLTELDEMVKSGLQRLYDFQHSDGGWGWWKEGESDHFMTAYVLWGMTLARDAGVEVKADVMNRAAKFLNDELVEEESSYDSQAWMLHALAAYHATIERGEISAFQQKAFDNLWNNRDRLNAYSRALLALTAHQFGFADKAKTLIRNLENGVKRDTAPDASVLIRGEQKSDASVMGTAHWGEDGLFWRWSDGGVEATATALRALLTIDPQNKLIEPVTNWLIKNRRGAQWNNTRDTAMVILTLNDYLRVSGELRTDLEYELIVNGQTITTKKLTAADAFSAPSVFAINREFIRDGANDIRIVRKGGASPVYFAAQAQFFSREEPLQAMGSEIFVKREYFKMVPRQTLLKGYVYDRVPLRDGESVVSGERIETVLTIEAKNNYEYLLFEDLKPAGFEAVQIRSGQSLYAQQIRPGEAADTQLRAPHSALRTRSVYQELRDRKVAMFIDHLPEGYWQIRYEMRAETPGRFHALPVLGQAMYVPEIRCNSAEERITVAEK
jgi:hypothetical protein